MIADLVSLLITGTVVAFTAAWVEKRSAGKRAARELSAYQAEQATAYGNLRSQLAEAPDWFIVGTQDPGVGVVLMVGQEPTSFAAQRTANGKWKPGPLGAKLPVYTYSFSGWTPNFTQIRGNTYEDALLKLMSKKTGIR